MDDQLHEIKVNQQKDAQMTRVRVEGFTISLDGYGAGPNTIQQYLHAGLIDELHVAISPVLLGSGERLFEGVDLRALGYECAQFVASDKATQVVLRRR